MKNKTNILVLALVVIAVGLSGAFYRNVYAKHGQESPVAQSQQNCGDIHSPYAEGGKAYCYATVL